MEGNWRGQMDYGGSQGNVERWRCEGEVGSFVWTAKGIKRNNGTREVLGRVECGDQRRNCTGEKFRGNYSFQSVQHDTQSWKQVVQNLGLLEVKQSNSQIIFPDGGYNDSYTDYQTRGLRYSTGSGEGISPFESERGLAEVHEIQVQKKNVLLSGPTFWLKQKSTAILQNDEVNSQSYQGEVQLKSSTIHGRPTDFVIGKETTGMRYGLGILIHERAGLEDVISQMQDNTNE
ncbi:MAG: hypothetical protein EZS28_045415 [Streblomastix strix]|uniref:Uncharacterized protein n=1 Tax=Streblomastix strix TaxID=222440 RepID=A0A5J4TLF8_9EUKA|nr:MAG: hypothetical protein EZS28_045415 [Streblomastix strix]